MVRMPDLTDLGARNIPQSSRGVVGYGSRPEYSGISEIGKSIENIGIKTKNDIDEYDYAQAKSLALRDKVRLEREAAEDPDFNNYQPRFQTSFAKTKEMASKLIQNPERQKLFELELGALEEDSISKLSALAKNKEIEFGKANLTVTLDENLRGGLEASDEMTASEFIKTSYKAIDGALAREYISPVDAVKLKMNFRKDYANKKLESLTPEQQIKELVGNPVPSDIIEKIKIKASQNGISENFLLKTAGIESGFNPEAVNKMSGATGLFQIMDSTAKSYGLFNRKDADSSIDTTIKLAKDNAKTFKSILGREPTDAELYFAHQQGATGAATLIKNQDESALSVLSKVYGNEDRARQAILLNGGNEDMTAGEFVGLWQEKFESYNPEVAASIYAPKNSWVDFADTKSKRKIIESANKKIEEKRLAETVLQTSDNIIEQYPDDYQAQIMATRSIKDPGIRKKVEINITSYASQQKQFNEAQAIARQDRVLESLNMGGLDNIPSEDYAVLSASEKSAVLKLAQKSASRMSFPIDEREAKAELIYYNKVMSESEQDPTILKNYSAIELAANLPPDKVEQVLQDRKKIVEGVALNQTQKTQGSKIKLDVSRQQITAVYKDALKILDIPTGDKINDEDALLAAKLRDRLETSIEMFKLNNERNPNYKELVEIRDSLIKSYVVEEGTFFDTEMRGFEIPLAEREEIATELLAMGQPVTESLIINSYLTYKKNASR